jgi:hypothetical protein
MKNIMCSRAFATVATLLHSHSATLKYLKDYVLCRCTYSVY